MLRRAGAQGAPVQLAGIGFRIGQQLGQRLPRRVGAHDHAHDEAGDLQDVGQVLDRIVLERGVQHRLAQHAHVHLADRVAVGFGVLQRQRAQHAGRAALVLDDDRLSQLLGRRFRQDAEAAIGRTAGGPRDDQADRLVGEFGLGARRCGGGQRQECGAREGGPSCQASHDVTFPPIFPGAQAIAVDGRRHGLSKDRAAQTKSAGLGPADLYFPESDLRSAGWPRGSSCRCRCAGRSRLRRPRCEPARCLRRCGRRQCCG